MEYRFLGKSGLKVSELAMGTQTFGWGADQKAAHAIADRFVDAGGNMFDTSSTYNDGESESILGEWLKTRKHRDSLVVASKVYFATGDGANDIGLSRKHIFEVVERSLRRLRTDYVDIYQAHCYDLSTPLEETLSAFEDLVRSGNTVQATTKGVAAFTLLLSPDKFDFSQPVIVTANGHEVFHARVQPSVETLLKWAARDNDRTMLYAAELKVKLTR